MNYQHAREIAISICEELQPHTDKINIAGSVRRGKQEVKDIEVICLPKRLSSGLWQEATIVAPEFTAAVAELGKVLKGNPSGRYMQIELPELINLDLFMPAQYDYYRQYAIRTGSSDYSAKVIATAWVKLGWVGTKDGLRRRNECFEKKNGDGKSSFECIPSNPTMPPIWESEAEFFEWLGLPLLKPAERV